MERITIADACTLHARIGWQGLTKAEYLDEGDYYLITGVDFNEGLIDFENCHFVTEDRYLQDEHIQVAVNDVLVTKDGTIGKVAIVDKMDKPATLNSGVFVVRPKNSDELLPEFLVVALRSGHFTRFIEQIKVGCTIAHLNQEKFLKYDIPQVSVDEQRYIVETLSKAEQAIKHRKQELQLLDDLIKARFVELFGDPFDTSKWDVKELKDLSESMVDGSNVNPDYYESEGDVLFLRIQNVWRNEFKLNDSVYISKDINQEQYYDTSLKTGDLLITKIGRYYTKDSSLGRVSVYRGKDDCANYSNNIMRVRLKGSMNSEFVNALLNLDDYQSFIKRTSKGGTDKRALSKSLIGGYPIIMPPRESQDEFVDFVKQVDKSKFIGHHYKTIKKR